MLINILSQSNGNTLLNFNYYFNPVQIFLIGIATLLIVLSSIYGAATLIKKAIGKVKGTATLPR